MDKALTSKYGPCIAGGAIGLIAVLLSHFGNPGNMGICIACFTRDISGALGLHRAEIVQYLRPEIPGFLLGSFISALVFGEYHPRGGASPIIKFELGLFAMFGAAVFLGCPWRAFLRVAGGDWNALYGVGGLIVGVFVGIVFIRRGFSLGAEVSKSYGFILPLSAVILIALRFFAPKLWEDGPVFFSEIGPGAQHAPMLMSLFAGVIIGWLVQRSRFCAVSAFRDFIMMGNSQLLKGIISFTVAAFAANYALGHFKPGFEEQPLAHSDQLWNFLAMVLSGLALTLAGGCPGRQLAMAGEGDLDSGMFMLGILIGGGIVHTFSAISTPAGVAPMGRYIILAGLLFCGFIGTAMRDWSN